jgi:hypothetical protein
LDPGDGTTGTSVSIQNKVQCLGAFMKPCDCNLRDSQLRQLNGRIPKHGRFQLYRIGRHKVGDDAYYRIQECFYDENDKVVFWGESSLHGESADALIADLEQMLADASVLETTLLMFLQMESK